MTNPVAFIGLGNMGAPMAANLTRAGITVRAFDRVPAACEAARAAGVDVVATLPEAVTGAAAVITMLPAGQHVMAVSTEVLSLVAPGTLMIDCSTIDVDTARQVHELSALHDCPSVDAPVSGGTGGAKAATLTFMIGGRPEAAAQAAPFLAAMGSRQIHCGEGGAGQAAKICNNLILGISMIGVCEAFVLAEGLGLSAQALFDVASVSSDQCWSLTSYCPVPGPVPTSPANTGYTGGFAAALMLKDLRLAAEAAKAAGSTMPLGAQAADLFARVNALGHGGDDFSGIIRMLRDASQGTA